MVTIKTPREIKMIKEGGKILAQIRDELSQMAVPGARLDEIDAYAENRIREVGGEPSFKGYCSKMSDNPFPSTVCTSVNNEVVHGSARPYVLQEGDVVGFDIGMRYPAKDGFYTDTAITVGIGKISPEAKKLLSTTRDSLMKGLAQIKPGNFVHDISKAVEAHINKQGYGIVRDLAGHGVGHEVHEDPRIPNFYNPVLEPVKLKEGMVLAIEPMVNLGGGKVTTANDGWTVLTTDGSISAHFEHTVVVTKDGYEIVTTY